MYERGVECLSDVIYMPWWWNGRHVCLRNICLMTWGFESLLGYNENKHLCGYYSFGELFIFCICNTQIKYIPNTIKRHYKSKRFNICNKNIWQKLNFSYIRYNYITMRTTMVHISSFKQQEICSWYRYVENCSSENKVK